jgi:ketosteroid isomerase-like protein
MTDYEIVQAFVKAINDHDVDKIYDLMPENHVFIDGYGEKHVGKNGMKEGWQNC